MSGQIRNCLYGLLVCLPWAAEAAVSLQSGVLVDPDSARVWLTHPDSAVEQVNVASGRTEWRSALAALPMAVGEQSVLALREGAERGTLDYAVLARLDGQPVALDQLPLPGAVRALVEARLGERFDLKTVDGGLRWTYRRELPQGALLDADASAQKSGDAPQQGSLAIDWSRQRLQVVPDAALKASAELPAEIGAPTADGPRTFRSVSDLYRLRSERQKDGRYRWQISAVRGGVLGELYSDYSYRPFEVVGDVVLYVRPFEVQAANGEARVIEPTLVAYDLGAGKSAWTRTLRDLDYHGPYPP